MADASTPQEEVYLDEEGLEYLLEKFAREEVTIPSLTTGSYAYDGTAKTPTFTNLDTTKCIKKQESASFTNAGTYTITISLKDRTKYVWSDGTDADKEYYFTIVPVQNDTFSLSSTTFSGEKVAFMPDSSITYNGNIGFITAVSSDDTKVMAEVVGNAVVITPLNSGTCTIHVTDSGSKNIETKTISISCNITATAIAEASFQNATDEEFELALRQADAGIVDLYDDLGWRPGDYREYGESRAINSACSGKNALLLVARDHYYKSNNEKCKFVIMLCVRAVYSNSTVRFGQIPEFISNWQKTQGGSMYYPETAMYDNLKSRLSVNIPSYLLPYIKTFRYPIYNPETNNVVYGEDNVALVSAIEMLGTSAVSHTVNAEAEVESQYEAFANGIVSIWQGIKSSWYIFRNMCSDGVSPCATISNGTFIDSNSSFKDDIKNYGHRMELENNPVVVI